MVRGGGHAKLRDCKGVRFRNLTPLSEGPVYRLTMTHFDYINDKLPVFNGIQNAVFSLSNAVAFLAGKPD
jgi:hypothetical protein